jgi:hypothetical protein
MLRVEIPLFLDPIAPSKFETVADTLKLVLALSRSAYAQEITGDAEATLTDLTARATAQLPDEGQPQ